jgi:uncharacterized protein
MSTSPHLATAHHQVTTVARSLAGVAAPGELLVAVVMLVGVAGVVVPVLPGLLLVWAAGVAWVWLDGGGTTRIVVGLLLTALLVVGTVAKYALPARSATGLGAPRSTLVLGAAGAVAGFFLIPVVGVVVGGVGAVFLAEVARVRDAGTAWRSTRAVLRAVGVGMLIELATAVLMLGTWSVGLLLT